MQQKLRDRNYATDNSKINAYLASHLVPLIANGYFVQVSQPQFLEFSAFDQSLPIGTFRDIRALFFIVRDKKSSNDIFYEVATLICRLLRKLRVIFTLGSISFIQTFDKLKIIFFQQVFLLEIGHMRIILNRNTASYQLLLSFLETSALGVYFCLK